MTNFILQTLNGVTYAGLLFLLASGFTLIFGLMRILNLAHGGMYLLGGYIGYSAATHTGNFFVAAAAAGLSMAAVGLFLDVALLRRLRGDPLRELLITMGVALVMTDLALAEWGANPVSVQMPFGLGRSTQIGDITYPTNRLVILAVATLVALSLYALLGRTRTGAMIRAGVDNAEMVSALGINVRRLFTSVFVFGAFLAGLAGVLGASVLTVYRGADAEILTFSLIVVIVGGLGSLKGAVVGSLLVGLTYNYGAAYFPELAYFALFAPMVVILLARPQGLFGRSGA